MNRSDKKRSEFEDWEGLEGDDQLGDAEPQDIWESDEETPKRTPIRRKNRPRLEDFEPKHKREDKRKNKPLKYDW